MRMPEIGSEAPKTPPPSESSSAKAAETSGVAPPKELRLHPDSPRHLPEDRIKRILRGEDDNTPVTTQNPEITKLAEVRKYRKAMGLPVEAGDYPPMAGGNGEDEEDPGGEPEETDPPNREGSPNPEQEHNPERGRWLVEEIVRLRTTMTYDERYRGENGRRLRGLYDSLQKYVDEIVRVRNDPDPFGPHKAYPRPTQERPEQLLTPPTFPETPQDIEDAWTAAENFKAQYELEGTEESDEPPGYPEDPLPDPRDATRSITSRYNQLNQEPDFTNPQWREQEQEAMSDMQLYFRQAKRHGLLQEVDEVLNSVYQQITSGRYSPDQLEELLSRGIARARAAGTVEFREKSVEDTNIPAQLAGVWVPYIDWAARRIEKTLNNQPQVDYREGEWNIAGSRDASTRKETYWEIGSYPKYYHVTARTPEQFLVAKETFMRMVRSGLLGRSALANFEHVKNFIENFTSEGGRRHEEGLITKEFLEENRVELEGLLYLRVSSYAKDVYNPKQSKEAAMAMALDEGPARWVAAFRAGKGGVASFTQMFDYEVLMDIYNNPVGEQGELDVVAGHYLQDMIQEMAIERGMGVVLKDYDPRDPYFNSDDLGAKIAAAADLARIRSELKRIEYDISNGRIKLKEGETASSRLSERDKERLNAYTTNLRRLGLTKSQEQFVNLYEGFERGDTHLRNYQRFAEDQNKPEGERQYPHFTQLPESIRKSIDLGRVQAQLGALRQGIRTGEIKVQAGQQAIDFLSPRDRLIYQTAFEEASANFEISADMQNVLGEKGRRGRGFMYVDRNPHIQCYFRVSDALRTKWADPEKKTVINLDSYTEDQIKAHAATLPEANRDSFKMGWMLYKLRDGKKLDTFPDEWQREYKNLAPAEKEDIVDNIPTYQLENWVQWGVFWTKMQYADAPVKERRQKVREARERLLKEVKTKGYSAQLIAEDLVEGREPILMTYKRPLGMTDPATGEFKKFTNGEILGFSATGQQVILTFGNDGRPVGLPFNASGKLEVYDKADPQERQRVSYDTINRNTIARLVEDTLVEEVVPTFQFAASGQDFRSSYTVDTYEFYQGNNRVTKLKQSNFDGAARIAAGLSRPEDEDSLATRLLIIDPTRKRIKKLPDVQQTREVSLVASALLESFNDRMRIRHGIYRTFLPKDGYSARMRAGYRNEDWAGMDRFTFGLVEFAAQQPLRLARRMGAELAISPLEHDSGPARWGVHGVSGGIKLMADTLGNISKQKEISQFGLTKIFELHDLAVTMFNALVGYTDPQTGKHVFGLWEKSTDNFESTHQFVEKIVNNKLLHDPAEAITFLYKYKENFGRLTTVTQLMRVMYSNNDNSAGAVYIEDHEVFLGDGSFNTEIESNRKILSRNGIARNRQYAFLYGEEGWDEGTEGYYGWLQDERPGGGSDIYEREKYWASLLNEEFSVFKGRITNAAGTNVPMYDHGGKVKNWLTDKII